MKEVFKFNHEASDIPGALSIPKEIENRVHEIVFYSTVCNHLLGHELFDNTVDRPKSLTTVTGDLEKSIGYTNNDQELCYLLLKFNNLHELMTQCIGQYSALCEAETKSEQKKAAMLIQLLSMKLEEELEKREKDVNNIISPVSLINRIRFVKESKYNFEQYLELLKQNSSKINVFNPELFYESKTD